MRIPLIICSLLYTLICHSQRISIKIPLLTLVDEPSFPTIQSGAEFWLSKKVSWYNEAGIKYRKSYYEMADTSFVDSRGFKLKSEIRYYSKKKDEGVYIGCNLFYTKDLHNSGAGYYYRGDSSDYRVDNFSAKKIVQGLNLVAGKSYKAWGRFNFEVYSGIGVRFISIKNENLEIDLSKDNIRRSPDLNIPDNRIWMDVNGGKSILPNFSLGFRFCYTF